jgi:CBS domain-containing protein
MKAIRIAQIPPPTLPITATVKEAVTALGHEQGCAVAVMNGNRLAGTLSKDDVLLRVVGGGLNPETTTVDKVMTSPPLTASLDAKADEALRLMFSNRQCFLPIVDKDGHLKGWLAICHLFQNQLEDMTREIDSLEAYISADGPGG